jgi:hypothetical protein
MLQPMLVKDIFVHQINFFSTFLIHGRVISLVESVGQCLPLFDWLQFEPDGLFE